MNKPTLTADELELLDSDRAPGLTVAFYLPRLTDNEIELGLRWGNQMMADGAGPFGGWLWGIFNREQFRRRANADYAYAYEVETITVPLEFNDRELADALAAVSAWTYAVENAQLGKLADQIFWKIIALVKHRLTEGANNG